VVSDYDMPRLDGLALLERVREACPKIPFILFTGRGSEEIASKAISKGVTDHLQKGTGSEQYDLLANRCTNAVQSARERKQREQAEQWYYQLFDQRLVGVRLSQNGVYRQANDLFAEMLGRTPEEVVGLDVLETVVPEERERVQRALERRESGEVDQVRYTVAVERPDGSTLPTEVVGGTVTYRDEPAVLGLMKPVTVDGGAIRDLLAEQTAAASSALTTVDSDSDQLAEATESLEQLQKLLSEPQPAAGEEADCQLSTAVETAWDLLSPGARVTKRTEGDTTLGARLNVVVRLIEQILVGTVGKDDAEGTAVFGPIPEGFKIELEATNLEDRVQVPLVSNIESLPDPLVEPQWARGVDIYSNRHDASTVVYEVVFASMVDSE
jgi:PAS domain S-box-containing protein